MFGRTTRIGAGSVLAVAVAASAGALAQSPSPQNPQRPVFRSDTNLIVVDAYPLRDGQVISGLTAADFQVFEDGVLQTIDSFEFVDSSAPAAESARRDPNTVAESRELVANPRTRAFVVDLDIDHVSVDGSYRIRAPLVGMLNRMIGDNDLFAVMSSKNDPGSLTFARKIITTEDMLNRYWAWGQRRNPQKTPEELGLTDCFLMKVVNGKQMPWMIQDGERTRPLPDYLIERRRESEMLDHLDDLVEVVGQLREGLTSVVVVSEGWRLEGENSLLMAEIGELRASPRGAESLGGQLTFTNTLAEANRATCLLEGQRLAAADNARRLRDITQRAARRNISFYPVNPVGMVGFDSTLSEQPSSLRDDLSRVRARETGLRTLADATDGVAVVGSNDIKGGLARVADQLRSFYLLGYYSTNTRFDGRERTISVRVADAEVRARRGYRAPTEEERLARANPVTAPGPTAVERALDVLSGLRSSDDRTFNVSRYLKADAAPILGVPELFRATPSPRSPLLPVTAPAFTRRERLHVEWPVAEALLERSGRILGRNSSPLPIAVTLTERPDPAGARLVADAALGPLAPGDYVIEVVVSSASGTRTALVAFRIVP